MKSYIKTQSILLSALILGAGMTWIWLSRIPGEMQSQVDIRVPQIGFESPAFSLPTLNGNQINSDDLTGRPYILNFWASWCPPCQAEMPDFQTVSDEFSDTDLLVIAINARNQDSIQNVENFLENKNISFMIPLDHTGAVSKDYNIHSLPTTFFIDRQGTIARIIIGGPIPLPLLRTEAENLLQE